MKTKPELISLGHRLIKACNRKAPQLAEVEKMCNETKYHDKPNEPRYIRPLAFEIPSNASGHLKATHLAVTVFDHHLQFLYGPINFKKNLDDSYLQKSSTEDTQIFALCGALHHLHVFQQAEEIRMSAKHSPKKTAAV